MSDITQILSALEQGVLLRYFTQGRLGQLHYPK